MADSNAEYIYEQVRTNGIIAIVRGISGEAIIDTAEALLAGGVKLIEVTCNTPGVFDIIRRLSDAMSDRMIIGAGTVISADLACHACKAGARYMVAPDLCPEVVEYCKTNDLGIIPGVATATEILNAYRMGLRMVKIFPAEGLGTSYIKQLRGPIHDMDFIAVGGVTVDNLHDFIKAGCIGAGLGASLVNNKLIDEKNWQGITDLAKKAVNTVR